MIIWDEEKCAGCGICVVYCPTDALESLGAIEVHEDRCNDCFACIEACPADALKEGR